MRRAHPNPMMKRTLPILALGLTVLLPRTAEPATPEVRAQFRAALEAAEQGAVPAAPDSAGLRAYLLYPDLQGARLLAQLQRAPTPALDRGIAAFVAAEPSLPVTGELRRAWLLSLAERRLWTDYLRHYAVDSAEPALVCHYYQARIETTTQPQLLADQLLDFWQTAPQMPQACVPPFDWLKTQGRWTPDAVERRARKALADGNPGLAAWLIRTLPEARARPLQQWEQLLRDPSAALARLAADANARVEFAAVEAAFSRLAPRSPMRAAELLGQLGRERFDEGQYAELQRWVALGLSWDRRPEAIAWFEALPRSHVDERVHEWRVRAALWQQRFDLASMWLHAMPPTMAAEQRWTYWRARSLELLGRDRQARPLYEQLSRENGYYCLLAAWRLGQRYAPSSRAFPDDLIVQSELLERDGVRRAHELFLAERDRWANEQWRRVVADLDATRKLQAARLASHWGWHIQAVTLLAGLDIHDMFELSYPDPYAGTIREQARAVGLAPEIVYGVMRQESLFNPRATSPANAYGLLQLLLPTAREVARRRGDARPDRDDLMQPQVNIPLGATFLRELHARFDGQWLPALAGYNAGPNAVKRWLPKEALAPDIWIENIPYNQTRGYVQKVLWHVTVHRWRRSGEPQAPSDLLHPVREPS
ncbi:soluble lytic murein transglycosylase [Sinimarinibacterium flocculans]|uniref:Soluble lytic murein transglycosylase n=3 Tax=Sinimarinibacterium flocculans TaxID=985250 RepID=A0A318E714_9GAMM|nr:soluble lytic murein transglycosylase [Sinimarinibacterium flocculans]